MKVLTICFALVLGLSSQKVLGEEPVFELRTYTAAEGKMESLLSRFREHTLALFESHGMENVGYWVTREEKPKLVYILKHKSEDAAQESWAGFRNDPKWKSAFQASRVDGPLVKKVESKFLSATDFSKIQ